MIDDCFDNDYSEYLDTVEKILFPLSLIAVGIPFLIIYYMYIQKPARIYPFGVGNYIHAQYENIIRDAQEKENTLKCNRWNYKLCEV